jgi:hypothetical protein
VWVEGGRTPTPGFAMGLRRRGMAPKAGAGEGCAITAVCMLDFSPSLDASASETRSGALTSRQKCHTVRREG